jgi:hypothetical protein
VFFKLLFKASYKDKRWEGVDIKRGQLVTGRAALSKELNLSEQVVRTCLDKLTKSGYINQQSTNRYTIITICNYDSWQTLTKTNNQQLTSEPTNNQPTDNHYINKYNKESKDIKEEANASMSSENDAAKDVFDYDSFCVFFNNTLKENDSRIPRIKKLDSRRKNKIHARIKDYGVDAIYEVTQKVASNNFLNGGGNKGWIANFDWIFGPDNFRKVIEGNYDDKSVCQQPKVEQSKIDWE